MMLNNQIMQMMTQMGGGQMNPIQMLQMINGNPQQMMQMFGNNPTFQQATQMMNSGANPNTVIENISQQMGLNINEVKNMARMFGMNM